MVQATNWMLRIMASPSILQAPTTWTFFSGNLQRPGLSACADWWCTLWRQVDDDKQSTNANYKLRFHKINGSNGLLTQNNLPGFILKSNSNQDYNNSMFRQKLSEVYQVKLDPAQTWRSLSTGTLKHIITASTIQRPNTLNDVFGKQQHAPIKQHCRSAGI